LQLCHVRGCTVILPFANSMLYFQTPGGLSEGVEVALDPSELELDPAAMQAR
jgi:hypothetical protein